MKASFAVELRAEGRTILGPAIRYGDYSASHQELFERGAFAADLADTRRTRWLSYRHDCSRLLCWTGAGLELIDGPDELALTAQIPDTPIGNLLLREVNAGEIRGLSLEFQAEAERRDGDIRVVERARLVGVGAVHDPAYPQSRLELRAVESEGGIITLESPAQDTEKPPRHRQNWSPQVWL